MSSTALTANASPRHLLGAELRHWRQARGLSTSQLAALVFVSRELMQKVETAHRNASADLIAACDRILDTGGSLGRLLEFAVYQERRAANLAGAATQKPAADASPPMTILVRVTAELVPAARTDGVVAASAARPVNSEGARIYRFPSSRHSSDRR
ncbi:helix-turn-helix domain-containing protein [Dactylosporangium vinaceum]|uniref:Multiprotein-bridging factor 1 family protein n=1 Tax=Dactylosporangium vinaceum TaxID=53362 RepID=A0ABV5MQS5_9ACTN|nr:helix-turn-helix transcriptional regulator [Dactylosporangium vinaceum]UAB96372.1 helix-turn-helix domain-containing protein [Dactylosporangium vinaceum]